MIGVRPLMRGYTVELKEVFSDEQDGLYEFMERITCIQKTESILDFLQSGLERDIYFDMSLCIFKIIDGLLYCLRWPGYSDHKIRDFNTYYNKIAPSPYIYSKADGITPVDWRRCREKEFAHDFMISLGIYKTIGTRFQNTFTGEEYFISPHRSKGLRQFPDEDFKTLIRFGRIITNVFSMRSEIEYYKSRVIHAAEVRDGFEILSKREAEITELLCRRMTMREIACELCISPRTVERHASHIYLKLNVDNRRDLLKLVCSCLKNQNA